MVKATIILKHVLQLPAYQKANAIAIFLSMPGREVSTRDIVLQALQDGKSVFVPYLHPGETPKSKVMDMLQLRDKSDFDALTRDAWGIPSISEDSVDKRRNALGGIGVLNQPLGDQDRSPILDLIFMPAVAFDLSHQRLGHGKGFYDRYLRIYKNALDSCQTGSGMPPLSKNVDPNGEFADSPPL